MSNVSFPDEIWENILINSSVPTLSTMCCVSKRFNNMINGKLWDFIDLLPPQKKFPIPRNKPTLTKFFYIIDWTSIVCNDQKVPEDILTELVDQVDLVAISSKQKLSNDFIRKHFDKLPAHHLIHNQTVSTDILEKIINNDVRVIATYALWEKHFLDYEFIKKYFNHVNWMALSSNKNALSVNIIDEFHDKLFWPELSKHGLAEWLIAKYIHKIDKFSWSNIAFFSQLSRQFIIEHIDDLNLLTILHTQELGHDFIIQLIEYGVEEYDACDLWNKVSANQRLSRDFLEKYKSKLSLRLLIRNPRVKRKDLVCVFGNITL